MNDDGKEEALKPFMNAQDSGVQAAHSAHRIHAIWSSTQEAESSAAALLNAARKPIAALIPGTGTMSTSGATPMVGVSLLAIDSVKPTLVAKIEIVPLTRANWLLSMVLPRRLYEGAIRPAIADIQLDYAEEIATGHPGLAKVVGVRGYLILTITLIMALVAPLIDLLRKLRD
jgi:hypothetical protein